MLVLAVNNDKAVINTYTHRQTHKHRNLRIYAFLRIMYAHKMYTCKYVCMYVCINVINGDFNKNRQRDEKG